MKQTFLLLILFVVASCGKRVKDSICLSDDADFTNELVASGLVHSPLPMNANRSCEADEARKQVTKSERLTGQLDIRFANATGRRAVGSPSDPDYATYGTASATLRLGGRNLEEFNRISFTIEPDCDGARVTELNLSVNNRNREETLTGQTSLGAHLVVVKNHVATHCVYDIDILRRDCVDDLTFYVSLKGQDLTDGDSSRYVVRDICLERVEQPQKTVGWLPEPGRIVYSTTGYGNHDKKVALLNVATKESKFMVVDAATGKRVLNGTGKRITTMLGNFLALDFSGLTASGTYRLKIGEMQTEPFRIGQHVWNDLQWRALNFLFCQRCGYHVPGIHGRCHADLLAEHNGEQIPFTGGWHDAGDLSQQTLQTADVVYSLFEAEQAAAYNPALAARLREEALWGLDFVMRMRFGDGYRASSMGLLIWQDGKLGTMDDIHSVRVQNMAFDNFLYAGVEAYAAQHVAEDEALRQKLMHIAEEDFAFAKAKFDAEGYDRFVQMYEHSYNTSHSQYQATISWAASMLFQLTGKQDYAEQAVRAINYTLQCQRREPLADGTCGFFYRDTERKSIVHYIHQSREQVYMQALQLLLVTQPAHPDADKWRSSMALYGNYLKGLMQYTAPYGMIPSGVYADEEYRDSANFYALHLFPPTDANRRYVAQLKGGVQIDEHHYVKRFPVWFNIFNGNNAVALSQAKAAAICGEVMNDDSLREIAQAQLRWLVGENPFAQSMVAGEGNRYPQLNSFSSGEMTGAMPVGIRTIGDTDEPFWPQTNNACYKEVWVTVAGKALSVIAELGIKNN